MKDELTAFERFCEFGWKLWTRTAGALLVVTGLYFLVGSVAVLTAPFALLAAYTIYWGE